MPTLVTLPISVPYLKPHGDNWAIFMMRFWSGMKATCRWAYFTGKEPCPRPKGTSKPTSAKIEATEMWEYEDTVAQYLLSQCLPDSTVMCLSKCQTAFEQWETITQEYQAKSAFVQADLHQVFLDMYCAKEEDIWKFLADLCYKREELAAAGVQVTEKEYEYTILQGILSELVTFVLHLLSLALITHGATYIDLDALIHQICEEAVITRVAGV